jgi:hypothetical protein
MAMAGFGAGATAAVGFITIGYAGIIGCCTTVVVVVVETTPGAIGIIGYWTIPPP